MATVGIFEVIYGRFNIKSVGYMYKNNYVYKWLIKLYYY
jgi:hypothetical protein